MSSNSAEEALTSGEAKASSIEEIKELIQEAKKYDLKVIRVQIDTKTEQQIIKTKLTLGILEFKQIKNNRKIQFDITFK